MKNHKTAIIVSVLALAFAGFAVYKTFDRAEQAQLAGATPGSQLIENYSPEVLYNGGINSALPIQTSSDLTAGSLNTVGLLTAGSLLIGNGTTVGHIVAPANCTIIANATTIAASSSKDVDCAVTGLLPTDTVYPIATSSLSTTYLGVDIVEAHASSTAGFATLTIVNQTGTTFTWTAAASTSVRLFGIK